MRWFYLWQRKYPFTRFGLSDDEMDKLQAADIVLCGFSSIYLLWNFLPPLRGKILVITYSNDHNHPDEYEAEFQYILKYLKNEWKEQIIVSAAPVKEAHDIVDSVEKQGKFLSDRNSKGKIHIFHHFLTSPALYTLPYTPFNEREHKAMIYVAGGRKGWDIIKEFISEKEKYTKYIFAFGYANPEYPNPTAGETWKYHFQYKILLYCSPVSVYGRKLTDSFYAGQIPILFNRGTGQIWGALIALGLLDYLAGMGCYTEDKKDFYHKIEKFLFRTGKDILEENSKRIQEIWQARKYWWDWTVCMQRFEGRFNLPVSKDMMLFHLYPANYWTIEELEDRRIFPSGEWEKREYLTNF